MANHANRISLQGQRPMVGRSVTGKMGPGFRPAFAGTSPNQP